VVREEHGPEGNFLTEEAGCVCIRGNRRKAPWDAGKPRGLRRGVPAKTLELGIDPLTLVSIGIGRLRREIKKSGGGQDSASFGPSATHLVLNRARGGS